MYYLYILGKEHNFDKLKDVDWDEDAKSEKYDPNSVMQYEAYVNYIFKQKKNNLL